MPDNKPVAHSRRALLGAAATLILAAVVQPRNARAQTTTSAPKMKIGIIGAGHIGGTLGALWAKAGHPVMLSSRHPDQLKDLVTSMGPTAQAGTVEQAIAFGDAILIAIPYGALPQLGIDYGKALSGKIVLDACNAMAKRDGAIAEEVQLNGIGITSQKYLPQTRLVRAFNTLNFAVLEREANRSAPRLAIPIAGDDAGALEVATALVDSAGFEAVTVGKLADASRFQFGGPGFGQNGSAEELRQKLSLKP